MALPDDLKYTSEHEWVRELPADSDGQVRLRVGITDYAQQSLGDVVYVTLPEVDTEVSAGSPCGELESTKSVNDVYAPLSGTIVGRNEALDDRPELVNGDPYGDGWMFELVPADRDALDGLLDAEAYAALIAD